jgi:diguanylate cyclase (GGDEF)-like protein
LDRAQVSDYKFAVLFADVDRFKAVNDSIGHLAGDKVLQSVAGRLATCVRPCDAVARYGGDEFVVVLGDVHSEKSVSQVAQRIGHGIVTAGMLTEGEPWRIQVTVSIGAAICDRRDRSGLHAIERADRAMYQAKSQGRCGRFVIDNRR